MTSEAPQAQKDTAAFLADMKDYERARVLAHFMDKVANTIAFVADEEGGVEIQLPAWFKKLSIEEFKEVLK